MLLSAQIPLLSLIVSVSALSQAPFALDPGFNISNVAVIAKALPSHSWEYGTATQALLEIYSPHLSVFGPSPFPVQTVSPSEVPGLAYALLHIPQPFGSHGLSNGDGAVGDPASLGVGAVMIGKTNASFSVAVQQEIDYVVDAAPKWPNGAISHRASVAELWADFIYMAPPFLAFAGADQNNASLLEIAYRQCGLYREVCLFDSNATTFSLPGTSPTNGRWRHIIGPQSPEHGLWSSSNGWAAAGMARVLATVMKAPVAVGTSWRAQAISDLTAWIKEIVDGARASPTDDDLLRNYLDDISGDGRGFGEISGSSLIAAVAYRMVILTPKEFPAKTYIPWADNIRKVISGNDAAGNPHITSNGTATPAVNPLSWLDTKPWTAGSPEGNNFVVLMYAAWRDCVYAGVCEL
ncbi:hypothetical protein R3P38DRAFT_1718021 [Favolaschia claudopus]|uniref:Six-hairpin glycosidase n=1 Tax=Favolaschia claudopus TaxID=2862362 RepID=A0AAW0A9M9_9AGAR